MATESTARKSRAGRGDARVIQGPDGRWYTFVELPPGPDGKRRRKKISATTRGRVVARRNAVRGDLEKGVLPSNDKLTVAAVVNLWLDAIDGGLGKAGPATRANYRSVARRHLTGGPATDRLAEVPCPAIGRKKVSTLTDSDVERLLVEKLETLSPRTVKLIRTVLGAALGWAERKGHIPRNVVRFTASPTQEGTKHRSMTEEQAWAVLDAAKGTRYEAAFALMLSLGPRPGECLGLRWSNIDLDAGTVTIRHSLHRDGTLGTVKNDGSRRRLKLPNELVPMFRARRAAQAADKLRAGEYWCGDPDPLVFTTDVGRPVSDRNLAQRDFADICATAEVGTWHLHECRHTAATVMLTNGVPIEVVSKILGHADIRMTANVYAHLLDRHLEPAVEVVSGALWRAERVPAEPG